MSVKRRLMTRAIRGAWCVARHYGLCRADRIDGVMDRQTDVRKAIVAAWLAGYRNGQRAARVGGEG